MEFDVLSVEIDDVLHVLLEWGRLSPSAVINAKIQVTDLSRRNKNFRVVNSIGSSFFLKQPGDVTQGGRQTIQAEAAFYKLCSENFRNEIISEFIPNLLFSDTKTDILCIELVDNALLLSEHYTGLDPNNFSTEVPILLGRAIGALHKTFLPLVRSNDVRLEGLITLAPWSLGIFRQSPYTLATSSLANLKLLQIIQQDPTFRNLEEIERSWFPTTVVHGDIRSENILISGDGQSGNNRVTLIDWETAQIGDPAWDIAGVLKDFVVTWLRSIPSDAALEDVAVLARYPVSKLHQAIRAFWHSYCTEASLQPTMRSDFIARAVRFSAVRLIATAYESGASTAEIPPFGGLLLQVSSNLLLDTDGAQVRLYGLFET